MHNRQPGVEPEYVPADMEETFDFGTEPVVSAHPRLFGEGFGRTVAVVSLGLTAVGISAGFGARTVEAADNPQAVAANTQASAETKAGAPTVHDKVKAFYLQYKGQDVNEGGAYGYQCTSLADAYAHDMFGVPHTVITDDKGTHNNTHGDGRSYYEAPDKNLLTQFVKMPKGTLVREGDIVSFGAVDGNPHGHVAIALANQVDNTVWIMEQNAGSGNGDGQGANATRARKATLTPDFLGVLRPMQSIEEEKAAAKAAPAPVAPAPAPTPNAQAAVPPDPGHGPQPVSSPTPASGNSGPGSKDTTSASSNIQNAPEFGAGTGAAPNSDQHPATAPGAQPKPTASPPAEHAPQNESGSSNGQPGSSDKSKKPISGALSAPEFDVPAANPSAPGIEQDMDAVFGGNEANLAPPPQPAPQPKPEQPASNSEAFPHFNTTNVPPEYVPLIEKAAKTYGIDPSFLATQLKIESDIGRSKLPGVHSGKNSAGAMGPAQFIETTWKAYAVDGDGNPNPNASQYDPASAVMTQARYDAAIHRALQARGLPATNELTLVWYNGGSKAVDAWLAGHGYAESIGYVDNFNKFLATFTR